MKKIQGCITALVTPMRNGAVDEDAFQRLVERQIAAGVHGVVPVGTTGESATLSHAEHRRVISLCVEVVAGRVPVIAGAGSNATAEALALARFAEEAGADALLTVTGYYNKPSQAGLIAHFTALHDATGLPIILYNVPGRTVANLSVETIATLSRLPRIVGVKDATGDLARVALQRLASGEDFTLLSGEDMTAVGFNAMGGRGCIGVTANVAPELCARMQNACLEGDYATALALQDRLAPLHDALFRDTSPGPVKYAMSLLGLCSDELRLPLVSPPEPVKQKVREALSGLGLID
ncbi:4-hydroxy-tetrahydrodipicolinate synthase [Amphiplicatus metriothermophilus]|uniref:4-hydroxy-tetrahydrodipicolinate synthase n=1 Tax=Amphiplicatus metriothermophilus TaxID=1519374 RepID=A0A239PQ40_9PROT|nr:4-hydroxy-tetrahydrodipicolinate synthase [Amphiplicatus metriothermophilus]MBB5518783.1 4-hydroxy-tetrahydrodipicolinate synthase [Amphiplicatus metriothermophilus]SNT72062.1 4-hydroxy-tetrahydrodipicolinate synthase [Amphiplicatus metriothermophilus]